MGDLKVLLGEVTAAALGIRTTMDDMATIQIDKIAGPGEQYGHDGLAGSFTTFCERWQVGVAALLEDATTIADGLDVTVMNYAEQDRANAEALGIPIAEETPSATPGETGGR